MIGNAVDAALAETCPEEFLYSDDGSSRLVYLINGVIYKVDRRNYRDNEAEFLAYKNMTGKLPTGISLPKMSLFQIGDREIIAAEFIRGIETGDCYDKYLGLECLCGDECIDVGLLDALESIGWRDPTYGNAILSDGTLYLVDLA